LNTQEPLTIHPVPGVALGTAQAGIKKPNHPDLVMIQVPKEATCVAAFTLNRFCAAPVTVAKEHLESTEPRWLLINTGYANAGLGSEGIEAAQSCCRAVGEKTQAQSNQVLPFSTGVIGEPLPVQKIVDGIEQCLENLGEEGAHWQAAAAGIMTTDTRPKVASTCQNDGVIVTGISKGAGMICPNMATMLGFVAINQTIEKTLADQWLKKLVAASFNAITIDGDTSTNDAVVLICHGVAEQAPIITDTDPRAGSVYAALEEIFKKLAQAIVLDGEGATKFVTINVAGAGSQADCDAIARTIAHSPLVKTALYASDPNWGRILAAIGRAPVSQPINIEEVCLQLNGLPFVEAGSRVTNYDESAMTEQMQASQLVLDIKVGVSEHSAFIWTSDLSHDYVTINAEYRS